MNITEFNVADIKPYDKNPRKNDKAVDYVANSIREFGFKVPIVLDKDNVIVAGHTRFKAAKKLGLKVVPCIVADDLSEEQIKAFRLADNKVAERAEWDDDLLEEELGGIFDIDMAMFDFDDLFDEEPEVIEDEYEPVIPEVPTSKLGQIYKLGRHRLMVGDSTKMEDVKRLVGENQVDMFLTDPPYGVSYQANGSATEARARHRRLNMMSIQNDDLEGEEFVTFLFNAFNAAKEVMKPGAVFYIWYADAKAWYFREALNRTDMEVRQVLIWKKNSLVLGRQDYQWIHEPCLYGWKDGAAHLWASDRKQSTIFEFDKPKSNDIHPTMKPIPLFDYQIKNNTKGGDIVLDLFAGSGTTIMACEQNGRNACCMEFDPKYADAIIKRWEDFTGDKAELIEE